MLQIHLYKAAIGLKVEGRGHKTIGPEALPICTHIPHLKCVHKNNFSVILSERKSLGCYAKTYIIPTFVRGYNGMSNI